MLMAAGWGSGGSVLTRYGTALAVIYATAGGLFFAAGWLHWRAGFIAAISILIFGVVERMWELALVAPAHVSTADRIIRGGTQVLLVVSLMLVGSVYLERDRLYRRKDGRSDRSGRV